MNIVKHINIFLVLMAGFNTTVGAQEVESNKLASEEKTEKYFNVGDAKIHYEVYGEGSPVLLLHGGLYGSIEEFKSMIPILSKTHKVIAITTRGHGKSEIGIKKLSYKQFAEDAVAVLKNESKEPALVIGFSDGASTAYILASKFPAHIKKIAALGGGLSVCGYNENGVKWLKNFSLESLSKESPDFVKNRKAIMPEPARWDEFILKMKEAWMELIYLTESEAKNILCPVLIVAGDRDYFRTIEQFVSIYKAISTSQLAIIPNTGHAGLVKNPLVFKDFIEPFLKK